MIATRLRAVGLAAIGMAIVVAAWWVVAVTVFSTTGVVPAPDVLIRQMQFDGLEYYGVQIGVTLSSAAQGYVWGVLAALVLASVALLFPRAEPAVTQIGVLVECIPLAAIGPVMLAIVGGRTPSIFLAAMSVFFTTLLATLLGVHASRRVEHDLVRAYGGGRFALLAKVQIAATLPAVFTGLKIAVPASLIGAILGEYLGGVDSGIGVALAVAQRSIQIERTWIFGLSAALIASIGYGLLALAARLVLPWARPVELSS